MAKSSSKTDFKNLSSTTSTNKRIESPLAKYNSLGQLTCIVCNQIIKSELIWNAHLNSKQHLENKQKLKEKLISGAASSQQQQKTEKTTTPKSDSSVFKRPLSVSSDEKTSSSTSIESSNNTKKQKLDNLIRQTDSIDLNNPKKIKNEAKNSQQQQLQEKQISEAEPSTSSVVAATSLPEGFFDDPDMDDKVRGVSREANLEAEYEEFKKIIQAEEQKAEIIVEQDDALRDIVRDLEQVDDLIERWNKIESLHQKREALLAAKKIKNTKNNSDDEIENEPMDHDHKDQNKSANAKNSKKDESDEENDDTEDLDNVLGLSLRAKQRC